MNFEGAQLRVVTINVRFLQTFGNTFFCISFEETTTNSWALITMQKWLSCCFLQAPPFIRIWNDTVENRYEGYLIDVLNILAENFNFTWVLFNLSPFEGFQFDSYGIFECRWWRRFTLTVVKDGKYGSQDPSGSWNGIVGEVMRGEAHIGLANLGQSKERSSVVDFPSVDISYEYAGIQTGD